MNKVNTTSNNQTLERKYKTWIIAVAMVSLFFAMTTMILLAVLVSSDNNYESKSNQANNSKTSEEESSQESNKIEYNGLDVSKLITQDDLEAGEIPDHYVGDKNAKVIVIEYEDFACSYCQALAKEYTEKIHEDYKDRVLFIHRGFSLNFPNSDKTLRASEAAYQLGGQEAYWAMFRLLYKDTTWMGDEPADSQSILNGYAVQIGLDANKFEVAMSDVAVTNKVTRDKEIGVKAGVTGTPTWFINGKQVTARDSSIRAALDAVL